MDLSSTIIQSSTNKSNFKELSKICPLYTIGTGVSDSTFNPREVSSKYKALWYTDSNSPGPNAL